jgi:hypothetical protein
MRKIIIGIVLFCSLLINLSQSQAQMNQKPAMPTIVYTTGFVTGELPGKTVATLCPTITGNSIMFKAESANTGNCYIGGSSVAITSGSLNTNTGLELDSGDSSGWIPVKNLNQFYYICNSTFDHLTYMVIQ